MGFHGCDKSIREDVVNGKYNLKRSTNEYDWLGSGIYFWQNSPKRAFKLCVRNNNCIKGFFIPKKMDDGYPNP